MKYDVAVIGLGYIGLPTASIFALKGLNVLGVDIRQDVVATINAGRIHIVEPELATLVQSAVGSGHLRASTHYSPAHTFIIAVPTPFIHGDGQHRPDLTFVESASRMAAPHVEQDTLVILESTSPVGTTEQVKAWVEEERSRLGLKPVHAHYAHCPERILPGQMIKELITNDRICGGLTREAATKAKILYETFASGTILVTDARTAEMVKLTENACRDVGIAFANELSMICDRLGLDVWEVIALANHHPRVKILDPGPGVGGHCIAVDPWFIVDSAPIESRLIRTAREVNDSKPQFILEKVRSAAKGCSHKPTIACLGLAFKANVDDLRESPSLAIATTLANEGFSLLLVEPYIKVLPAEIPPANARLVDIRTALEAADIVVLLVNHREFLSVEMDSLKGKAVIDTRGSWKSLRSS
jgi:UDP-N-acetyl-D-mannosaminuronic acid dehydrogenase